MTRKKALGKPVLDEELSWPGYDGVLAWRDKRTNTAVMFETASASSSIQSYDVCLIGCQTTWRFTWPKVFAP